jgi:predicted transcriptional regulator
VAATSLKIPDELKERIDRLAARARLTPHAYMLAELSQAAERGELRERFAAQSAASERQALDSGQTIPVAVAFDYLEKRVAGKKPRRPRARAWRASK